MNKNNNIKKLFQNSILFNSKLINNLFILGIMLFVISCATTNTTSFTDPDFMGKKYSKICVVVEVGDFATKKELEKKICSELKNLRVETVIGSDLFPPTRNWTDEQIKNQLTKMEIDGYLNVQVLNQSIDDRVLGTTTVTETVGQESNTGNKGRYIQRTIANTTANSDRNYLSSFKTQLIDVTSDRVAYAATSNSQSGETFSGDFSLIFSSFAEDIAKDLKVKGHLK